MADADEGRPPAPARQCLVDRPGAERARAGPRAGRRPGRGQRRRRVTDTFSRRNQGVTVEEGSAPGRAWPTAPRPPGPSDGHPAGRLRLPVRGRSHDGAGDRGARALRSGPARRDRVRRHHRGRRAQPGPHARRRRRCRSAGLPVRWHFHNTRNTGYANAMAAVETGGAVLDASAGGSAAAPSPRTPRGTSPPRTSSTSSNATESEPASISVPSCPSASASGMLLGHQVPGQLARAGVFPPGG